MKLTFKTLDGNRVEIDFTLSGYSYPRKKRKARQIAENVLQIRDRLSGTQKTVIKGIMSDIGKKCGLLREFRENGII